MPFILQTALWEKCRPAYWSNRTLEDALQGRHIFYHHHDAASEMDREPIHFDVLVPPMEASQTDSNTLIRTFALPLSAKRASARCDADPWESLERECKELEYKAIELERRMFEESSCRFNRLILTADTTPVVLAGELLQDSFVYERINSLDRSFIPLLEYIRSEQTMDFGTMMANLATRTWSTGTLLTTINDFCLRQCTGLVPRPQGLGSNFRMTSASGRGPTIPNPYNITPRRLWDLLRNRVVELDVYAESKEGKAVPRVPLTGYWAISHSWTADMQLWMTPINHYQWPVPLPAGTTFEQIRWEAIRAGAEYCWLDVLCLRQKTEIHEIDEQRRREEWSIDVPTIGNVYRQARHVIRYFNGLGRPLKLTGWDDSRHWINRAWTLQETRPEYIMVNAGVPLGMHLPLRAKISYRGRLQQMREALSRLTTIVADAEGEYSAIATFLGRHHPAYNTASMELMPSDTAKMRCSSILDLTCEITQRWASNEQDKIAGLGYLLKCKALPLYTEDELIEYAWLRLVAQLPALAQLELLFNFPTARSDTEQEALSIGSGSASWIPTWAQVTAFRREPGLELQRPSLLPAVPLGRKSSMLTFQYDPESGALLVPCCARVLLVDRVLWEPSSKCYAVSFVQGKERYQDIILTAQMFNYFYCPQSSRSKAYVLITHALDCEKMPTSWVLAELLHPSPVRDWAKWENMG
ncbi:hypothetical protein BDZ91DRAFT_726707 [Kalaharituber pfeilii]|nr:hypothetical protein BDZ91DRAFT_726707 [Kalaharituber pfeilii]